MYCIFDRLPVILHTAASVLHHAGLAVEFGSWGINRALCLLFPFCAPVDTFCRHSGGAAKQEEEGWLAARLTARAPSQCRGPRSLRLRLWPFSPRHTDPQVYSTGSCSSAGKRVNATELPIGPLRVTKLSLWSQWAGWVHFKGICCRSKLCSSSSSLVLHIL